MTRTLQLGALALGIALAAGACSSSGGDGTTSTTARATTSEATTSTTEATTTAPQVTATSTTSADDATTTTEATPAELPPCQDLLQEYTDVFTPDDLRPTAAFFRKYAPLMPEKVAAASIRIAEAYEAVDGDTSKLNLDNPAMTADATAFSDWTAAGCPAA